ncbi:uroporphyrinogen-III synthase [Shimia ponticola]|uniref:uroporphyrinogen-III synthase n=1 Tax=Shimia ponticola TaxID=2582893 RepID=UPI0011BFC35C|nr:uroporphyrinogen-III synthase [Shimia ponticola]
MTQAAPICLITRPEPEAHRFAEDVRAQTGLTTLVSPLMRYAYPEVSIKIDKYAGVILTSGASLPVLKALSRNRRHPVYAVGAKTGQMASDAGFDVVIGPGDAAGLMDVLLKTRPAGPLLHLRGEHTRGDVAQQLTDGGIETEEVVVYQQLECDLTPEARQVLSGETPVILPLFSPRTADILAQSAPFSAPLYIVAMSDAVARQCRDLAHAAIRVADTPDAQAMLRCVQEVARHHSAG